MKYILTVLCLVQGLSGLLFAQAPEKFTYQSVVRNASGALHANALTGLQIRILQGSATGTEVFKEQHSVTTNANGLLSVLVGNGTAITGSLAGIDWVAGPYFMEAAIDLNGGTNYTLSSAVQLLSVPYSLYAKQSGRAVEAERAKTADNAVRYRAGNGIILRNDSILALEKDARWNAASLQGRPIAGAGQAHPLLLPPHPLGQQNTGGRGNHGPEVADHRKNAHFEITAMDVAVPSTHRPKPRA
jgi:hypothetical protein